MTLVPHRKTARFLLLLEHRLPITVTVGDQIAVVVEIGEIGAWIGLDLACEVIKLVIAIEMHLKCRAADIGATEQAIFDCGIAGCRE